MEAKNLPLEQQIFSVISWLAIITLLQLSVWPALKKTFGNLAFPAAFSGAVLAFTLMAWYLGLIRVPVQLGLVPFLILGAYHLYRKEYSLAALRAEWKWEILFLLCFFLMLDVRFVNPTISYAEKFMDHAFLESVIRNPVVPPVDPWFTGGTLNVYYYLGYWMLGCISIASGVPSYIAFNLCLPTIFALAAVNMYAIGTVLLDRFRWLPLLTFFIPNPALIWNLLKGEALNSAVWDSTRTISNTINEYPLFSFIWGDVHAHVMSIFNQCFLIFLLLFAWKRWETLGTKGRAVLCALAAISLGAMPLINTWDVLIYAPITVFVLLLIIRRCWKTPGHKSALTALIALPLAAVVSYLPFYVQLQTHTGGIGIVRAPSDPVEFLLVNGFFIFVIIAFQLKDIRKRPWLLLVAVPFAAAGYIAAAIAVIPTIYLVVRIYEKKEDFPDILAFFGLMILILCELIYLKDNMGETYFRMNTVFKAYLPSWIMLSSATFIMIARWISPRVPVLEYKKTSALIIIAIGILFIAPYAIGYNSDYGTGTLDGMAYLSSSHPGDYAAINYLRSLAGDATIVEAENGDYTYYSRISSFTGMPGIIGMPFHEFMWRSDDTGWFATRLADIRTMYEQPDQTADLMRKYNATYLIVGESERQRYNVSVSNAPGIEEIFSEDGTDIYQLISSHPST